MFIQKTEKKRLKTAVRQEVELSCIQPQRLKDFRGKQFGTVWLNSDDWLLITVLATSKIPAGTGYK